MKLKICGLTRQEDLPAVRAAGAQYAGFILVPESPRRVTEAQAQALLPRCRSLGLKPVLVVRNLPLPRLQELVGVLRPDVVQLHGAESPEYAAAVTGVEVWRAFCLKDEETLRQALRFPCQAVLADSGGGTGRPCAWNLARELAARRPTFLAGGLSPDNLQEAISAVRPYGVDLSSGVEEAPGIKSHTKLQRLGECMQ
ncbi:MAG: phosphoribosylanthranilate isomerase [Oligosphaeraceae bacterium]